METSPSAFSINNPCLVDHGQIPAKDDRNIKSIQFMGYPILYGRNAFSNDTLLNEHKESHQKCLWFHALCSKGCHVVLCIEGRETPTDDIKRRAAQIALRFSDYNMSQCKIAELRDVYKPEGSKAGVWVTWRTNTITL